MAINPLNVVGPGSVAGAGSVTQPKEGFGKVLKGQLAKGGAPLENQPLPVAPAKADVKSVSAAAAGPCKAEGIKGAGATQPVTPAAEVQAAKALDRVQSAQSRMDQILKLAESGKNFSPAELLSLQANMYRASQELDLAGKVVEKATGGVKQVLQTQV